MQTSSYDWLVNINYEGEQQTTAYEMAKRYSSIVGEAGTGLFLNTQMLARKCTYPYIDIRENLVAIGYLVETLPPSFSEPYIWIRHMGKARQRLPLR